MRRVMIFLSLVIMFTFFNSTSGVVLKGDKMDISHNKHSTNLHMIKLSKFYQKLHGYV